MTWFVHHNEKILGPFSTEKIIKDLKEGELSYAAHIWSKGQVEWVPVSEWEANLEHLATLSDGLKKQWQLRINGHIDSSLSFDEVVERLKDLENFKGVAVSPDGADTWVSIYSSYPFMEALNLSRRNFLRAPLMGLAKITRDASRFSYVVKTATLGQGGIGVHGLGPNFEPGTQVTLKVESEDLTASIRVNGVVVYNTDQGFVGIRFGKIQAESMAVILTYIKCFQGDVEGESNQKEEKKKAS